MARSSRRVDSLPQYMAKQYTETGGIRRKTAKKAKTAKAAPAPGRKTKSLQTVLGRMPGATLHPMSARAGSPPLAFIYKIMGKMFAIVSARGEEFVILKCDPTLAQALRQQYKGVGHRSHLDRRYWISVDLDADVPSREVKRLVDHSYGLVCAGLTAKQRAGLAVEGKARAKG
ncbi:MAG TPA: MmcQ/YjbR family DNA-binding protein [Steroidobacteraceae bacterium]|nr:MmcQ/YjbR family DNA-binding protein [Steroidobacteraceae bacterium]